MRLLLIFYNIFTYWARFQYLPNLFFSFLSFLSCVLLYSYIYCLSDFIFLVHNSWILYFLIGQTRKFEFLKIQRILLFLRAFSVLCCIWTRPRYLYYSQSITVPTHSCLFFCIPFEPFTMRFKLSFYSLQAFFSFYRSLSDSKSPKLSRFLVDIPAEFGSAVVWMVSMFPLISSFPSISSKPLGTVTRAPNTIGITVIFIFESFFSSLARSRYMSIFFTSFIFTMIC